MDIAAERPRAIDPALLEEVDLVVTLGRQDLVNVPPETRLETWDTAEPSERDIEGIEGMRLIREDIATRVHELTEQLIQKEMP